MISKSGWDTCVTARTKLNLSISACHVRVFTIEKRERKEESRFNAKQTTFYLHFAHVFLLAELESLFLRELQHDGIHSMFSEKGCDSLSPSIGEIQANYPIISILPTSLHVRNLLTKMKKSYFKTLYGTENKIGPFILYFPPCISTGGKRISASERSKQTEL